MMTMFQESALQSPVPQWWAAPLSLRPSPRPRLFLAQGAPGDVSPRAPGGQWSPGGEGQTALTHLSDGGPGPQHQPVQPGAMHQPQPPVPWPALGPSQGQDVSKERDEGCLVFTGAQLQQYNGGIY